MARIELPTRCCHAIGTSIGGKEKDRNKSRLEFAATECTTQSMAAMRLQCGMRPILTAARISVNSMGKPPWSKLPSTRQGFEC